MYADSVGCVAGVLECCVSSWPVWFYLFPGSLHPDLHGFYKWVFDALPLLNDFTRQVVVSQKDAGLHEWANGLRKDLGSRPYAWLRPDFAPPSPFLVIKDTQTRTSRILVEPHQIDAEFRKAWMPFFCRSGHPVITDDQFGGFANLELPRITGGVLQEVGAG